MPWRIVWEWRYSSTILDLSTRWRWVVSFTTPAALPRGERAPGIHWIGGYVGPRACLDVIKKRKVIPLPGIEPGRPARRYISWATTTPTTKMKYFAFYVKRNAIFKTLQYFCHTVQLTRNYFYYKYKNSWRQIYSKPIPERNLELRRYVHGGQRQLSHFRWKLI
jgi:hypothetical protein